MTNGVWVHWLALNQNPNFRASASAAELQQKIIAAVKWDHPVSWIIIIILVLVLFPKVPSATSSSSDKSRYFV
ncbi:hypothetical protein TYRP_010359 [Tyrophagus putrescentiae]|nr:hypothetical protein TYRP_010359 [Tyrophagus putrescentiae]